ncbi:hypothetical protein A4A49_25678 [Nicotiana attenuata]|uniref:Uncharacterized protein n=1 Tax=Nicotiana attenuata TaxID=49451 RepID=A0A314LFB9_NICAT|nr:hypothetical protein A4A49_25678 [Nicotiana attenuata]
MAAPKTTVYLLLLLVFTSILYEVEARNVVYVHCNSDSDCEFICKDENYKMDPFCYKSLCVCDSNYFCKNKFGCHLKGFECDDGDVQCINYTCQCPEKV